MQKDVLKDREAEIKDLAGIGAHFGYSRARRHPSVSDFIYGYKNKTAVIDLDKTLIALDKAKDFVKKLASEGKQVLLVGTKNEVRTVIKTYADLVGLPFVTERWIGGTFTNWKQIKKRIGEMKDYRAKEKAGELAIYTKRERTMLAIKQAKMEKYFSGLEDMDKLPSALFVVDSNREKSAVAEAKQLNIPVIALAGSDCDIRPVTYPIIANDASRASAEFFVSALTGAYKDGRALAQTAATAPETTKS